MQRLHLILSQAWSWTLSKAEVCVCDLFLQGRCQMTTAVVKCLAQDETDQEVGSSEQSSLDWAIKYL